MKNLAETHRNVAAGWRSDGYGSLVAGVASAKISWRRWRRGGWLASAVSGHGWPAGWLASASGRLANGGPYGGASMKAAINGVESSAKAQSSVSA
jgi:hypothetical protein